MNDDPKFQKLVKNSGLVSEVEDNFVVTRTYKSFMVADLIGLRYDWDYRKNTTIMTEDFVLSRDKPVMMTTSFFKSSKRTEYQLLGDDGEVMLTFLRDKELFMKYIYFNDKKWR